MHNCTTCFTVATTDISKGEGIKSIRSGAPNLDKLFNLLKPNARRYCYSIDNTRQRENAQDYNLGRACPSGITNVDRELSWLRDNEEYQELHHHIC